MSNTERPEPNVQQQAVIDSRDLDILVEAGAGSGKTTTMVNRYIRLISEGDDPAGAPLEPREILAITFTDKAAGELREKVREERQGLALRRGEDNPQAISMSDAWIGTFHSICNRILRAYPVEAGIDPAFDVIDDVTAETLRSDAFSQALTSFQGEDETGGQREQMIGLFSERALRELTTGAYDELRSRGIDEPRLPEFEDTPYPSRELEELAAQVPDVARIGGLGSRQKPCVEGLIHLFDEPGSDRITAGQLLPLCFGSTKEDLGPFCELLNGTATKLVAHEDGDRTRRDLDRLLELYGETYSRQKSGRSTLDYEDLQLRTVRLLRENRGIRNSYRDRFREIMVDEFQDTNQLQLDLINQLRGKETTLITVGDEMQSIYSFRHADVELFRARRANPEVTKFELTDNFRSLPCVITAVNEIGRRLHEQVEAKRSDGEKTGRHKFTDLTIGRTGSTRPPRPAVMFTGREGWKPLDLGELAESICEEADVGKEIDHFNEAEALSVARQLRDMVDAGQARQSEIVILLRARTRTDIYENALKQVGLSPYVVAGAGFWKSREAVELEALLQVIANPLNDEALIAALTSAACGLSTNALWLLRDGSRYGQPIWPAIAGLTGDQPARSDGGPGPLEDIPADDLERLTDFHSQIERLRQASVTRPLDELIEMAVTGTGYALADLTRDQSGNGMANIRRLASLAREFETAEGRDLRAFLNWTRLSEQLDSEARSATREETSDVVRIMTVHAAKGLEFKVVCVPDCGRSNVVRQNSALTLGRTEDSGHFKVGLNLPRIDGDSVSLFDCEELKEAARQSSEDEELRLFHVATTRAEDHLLISGVLPKQKKTPTGPDEAVSDSLPVISRIARAYDITPEATGDWPDVIPGGDEPEAEIDVIANLASNDRAGFIAVSPGPLARERRLRSGRPPLRRPEPKVFPNVPLSFTALNSFTECPTRFFAERVLRLGESGGTAAAGVDPEVEPLNDRARATGFGSAVHDLLEKLGESKWPAPPEKLVRQALEKRGVDPDKNLVLATGMIESFLDSDLGRRVRSGRSRFEIPLLMRIENVTVRGFADLLLESEPPLVLDYKTNYLGDSTPTEKMADYELQRDLYGLALARARGLQRIETAYVFLNQADEPVMLAMGPEELDQAESRLADTLREFTAGHFFGGPAATFQPCEQCWACQNLKTQRERALAA